ncbi:hypothetical protein LK07_30810 [Streptomyces pluripotens]|uniref:Uncharacterized protein n=1 Tax=Streptomyces pluripotens TaxID=1355015 RepID=A0A221P661_9ACTN|nr:MULTISPECIES: hypothetical protein [Streptomyces]ARP73446.1 hypothetical protein LK06_029615 [Streptomyces pluripotens]ASN27697.1 hypothetical protein LK07_30810 [Streptomyces pluripotens]MCH0557406.1 hypothetical protein [Streptomyces sp. MUM 16J]
MTPRPAAPTAIPTALDDRDLRRLERSARLLRTLGTRTALAGVLPDTAPPRVLDQLAAACRVDHLAVMIFPTDLDTARAELARRGLPSRAPLPSTVVRERVRRRLDHTAEPDVRILHIPVAGSDGDPRVIEAFVLADPDRRFDDVARDERLHRWEDHLAVTTEAAPRHLPALCALLRDHCGLHPDGGGHNPADGSAGRTVLYFTRHRTPPPPFRNGLPHRLELVVPGRHDDLLHTHLRRTRNPAVPEPLPDRP